MPPLRVFIPFAVLVATKTFEVGRWAGRKAASHSLRDEGNGFGGCGGAGLRARERVCFPSGFRRFIRALSALSGAAASTSR